MEQPQVLEKQMYPKVPSPDLMGPWGTVDQRQLDSIEYWLEHNIGADFVCVDGEELFRKLIPQEPRRVEQQSQTDYKKKCTFVRLKIGKTRKV